MQGTRSNSQLFGWLFFGLSGRISPAVYFLAGLLVFVMQLFPIYRIMLAPEGSAAAQGWGLAFLAAVLVAAWANFALTGKRLHDFGKPAGWAAVTLIVGFIVFIVLSFVKGDAGPNQYGQRTNAPA
jgi:uncharacterized membrane protein YhaH (DUF805 family)